MYCTRCGKEIRSDQKFCGNCGAKNVNYEEKNELKETIEKAIAGEEGALEKIYNLTYVQGFAIALLAGGIYLIIRKVIAPTIPLIYIGVFSAFILVFGGHGFDLEYLAAHLCGGGLMLGAFFMATDYVTSPVTTGGKVIFAALLGILTNFSNTSPIFVNPFSVSLKYLAFSANSG